jgi:hypothetical protein
MDANRMKLIRPPLPKTRSWKLTNRLRERLVGVLNKYSKPPHFEVWKAHSRWVWWKFYRDNK